MSVRTMIENAAQHVSTVRDASRSGNPRVLAGLLGPAVRGFVLQEGKRSTSTAMPSGHAAQFLWDYQADQPEMAKLYAAAKQGQWDGDRALDWSTVVDPLNPAIDLMQDAMLPLRELPSYRALPDARQREQRHALTAWMLSQFLHGEQGALLAACQVTESVGWFDGKLYGSTQVVDEGRHVEVFNRYLQTKLCKRYPINDNLYVIIDSLMADGRWDMKFLGMQIMVEGLALGAFGTLYRTTKEPLLKQLLKMVILDEARHVHYGVLALREHISKELTESERREREDWAFEVALLMRNRFMAYEVYEEWFEGRLSRSAWREFVLEVRGMQEFRQTMFSRLVPNLRDIGLMSPRILPRYEAAGLMKYFGGVAAPELTGQQMIADLDSAA